LQDTHEIIINTITHDEIIIRLDSVGNRVRWVEVFNNILLRNTEAIEKYKQMTTLYSSFKSITKKSPKNQVYVRRLRGGLQ
jgi:hypothetical protein